MADQIQIINQPSVQEITQENEFLFKFSSVFPFQFFPDEVQLDKLKMTIIKRDFFFSKRITTLPITTTIQVKIFRGPLTSSISIDDTNSIHQDPIFIRDIWLSDAITFHNLVQGMVIGIRQGVNLMTMRKDEIFETASRWGAVDIHTV